MSVDFIKAEGIGSFSRDKARKKEDVQVCDVWLAEFVLLELRGEVDRLRGFRTIDEKIF